MDAKILVVDRNEAFATMLQDMLVAEGNYHAEVAASGSEALQRLRQTEFDLTIVDMDLAPQDMTYGHLIQSVRQARPTMRLMLIPLMGEELPDEARQFDLQGTLSKPFFVDDLLPNIKEALAKEVAPPAPPPPPPEARDRGPAPSLDLAADPSAAAQAALSDLARETRADAVLLLSTRLGQETILAQVSTLRREQIQTLAGQSIATIREARIVAQALGEPDLPFEHNMFESETVRFYVMALPEDVLLVTVTPISTPLGTIRHNLRRAARDLAGQALT